MKLSELIAALQEIDSEDPKNKDLPVCLEDWAEEYLVPFECMSAYKESCIASTKNLDCKSFDRKQTDIVLLSCNA